MRAVYEGLKIYVITYCVVVGGYASIQSGDWLLALAGGVALSSVLAFLEWLREYRHRPPAGIDLGELREREALLAGEREWRYR